MPRESTVEGPGRGVSLLPGARLRIAGTPQKKGEGTGESAPERPEAGPPARPRETAHQSLVGRISTELADLGWPGDGGDVVMNVRSPVASYWRGLVLDRYDGTTWSPSPGLPRGGIEGVKGGAGKIQYWQTYYIQTRAPVPLFTGYVPAQVSLPRSAVKVDQPAGAPPRYLFPDKRPYKSLSWVPGFDPRELRRDTARHRSPAYLALPPVSARLRALAERLVLPAATDFDKAVRLEQFLRQNYGYGQDPDPIEPGEETTDSFIFLQESGICTNFSSAMTVMARLVGLPARVALGYRPGTYDLWSGTYVVRTGDAHAWVEIYFQDHGWVPFDPTPLSQEQPSALPLPRWNTPGLWQSGQFVLSLNNPGTAALGKLTGFEGWGETKTWALVVLAFASVLALAGALGRRRLRPGSGPSHASFEYSQLQDLQRRKVIGLFRKMEAVLAKAGFRRRGPGETIAEYGTAAGGLLSPQQEAIKWLAETASRAAYDPRPFSKDLVGEAVRRVENITRAVARSPGRGMTGGP
ncbi:MAG: transglutaminaseTgpA domain-containing protein [Dehalococcoidia bacterium]